MPRPTPRPVPVVRPVRRSPFRPWLGYDRTLGGIPAELYPGIVTTSGAAPLTEVIFVEDLTSTIIGALRGGGGVAGDLVDFEIEERLQEYEILRFSVPYTSAKVDLLDVDVVVRWRNRRYRISSREDDANGTDAMVRVEAEALWLDLADRVLVGDVSLSAQSPSAGLAQLLNSTSWTVGTAYADGFYSMDGTDMTVLEAVRKWARICGLEVTFDFSPGIRRVNLVTTQGSDRGVSFRYGHNLRNIMRRVEPPKVTRLYPIGRNDLTIDAVNPTGKPYIEDFTFYTAQGISLATAQANHQKDEVWIDTALVSDDVLYARAVTRLAERSQAIIAYDCSVIDLLSVTDAGVDAFNIGDTVVVRDSRFSFDVRTRINRIVRRPLDPWRNELTLEWQSSVLGDESQQRSQTPGYAEWVLRRDTNGAAISVTGTEERVAMLPELNFVELLGEMIGHGTITGTATGSGTVRLRLLDNSNSDAQIGRDYSWDFNAATFDDVTFTGMWSFNDLSGEVRPKLMAQITSGAGTLSIPADDGELAVLTKGLIGAGELLPTRSQEFTYQWTVSEDTGTQQTFTVPAGVTSLVATLYGAQGGGYGATANGGGGMIKARFPVTPGEVLQVQVGGGGRKRVDFNPGSNGWPDGGEGAGDPAGTSAGGGGGSSDIRRSPYATTDRIVVAGGGGGVASGSVSGGVAGEGGYPSGSASTHPTYPGLGGTQSAGGAGGGGSGPGGAGSFAQGGGGGDSGTREGGGGGGGWYGGGGGGSQTAVNAGQGGGGSSYVDEVAGAAVLDHATGVNTGGNGDGLFNRGQHGRVLIEW